MWGYRSILFNLTLTLKVSNWR